MSTPNAPGPWFRLRAWLFTPSGIATLFVAGLAIRLLLVGTQGFPTDMSAFKAWAGRLAERGPWDFYPRGGEEYFVDYPPGYLYVLWFLGQLGRVFGDGGIPDVLVKLPPIFADLGLAWVVMTAAHRLAPAAVVKRVPVKAIAAAAILLNPAIVFISAVWGQADSVVTLLVAGGLLLIGTGPPAFRREAAGMALVALAFGTKPQAVFVIPVVLLVLCWRHIWLRSQEGFSPRTGALRVAALSACGVATGFVMFAPFRMFPARAFDFYSEASRTYKVTSVFAFNLWGALGFWRPDSGSDAVTVLGVPVVIWGIALFIAIGALVLGRAWAALRHGVEQGRVLVFGSVALTLVGFAVVTRIHERYLFMPLALAAMLVSNRLLRRAMVALSLLYLVNVYFPYVYYVELEGLHAPKLWGLYDVMYGSDIGGVPLKLWSVVITVVCLLIVWFGWRALESTPVPIEHEPPAEAEAEVREREPWSFDLHAIGRRGAAIAFAVFAVALLSRIAGLGHPPGMYFDEVYHARTGAEYLTGKDVFEYTHPPFAKEAMGFSIQHLSGFKTEPCDVPVTSAVATKSATLRADTPPPDVAPSLVRVEQGEEVWRATLPAPVDDLAAVGERAYVVTSAGELVTVSPEGNPETLAIGAGAVASNETEVWVTFPVQKQIASWDGERKRTADIELPGEPVAVAAPEDVERAFVAIGDEVISYDTESKAEHVRIPGGAGILATVPEVSLVWAVDGRDVRAIEPHSGSVIGRTSFDRAPGAVFADTKQHRLVGIGNDETECASGRPQFAWRLGSAIAGAGMVLFAFLLAFRLSGSMLAALLAALFLTVDGLAFTISRIAMNDSYSTALILASWFCVLSALRMTRDLRRSAAVLWLAGAGVAAGFAIASKWPGLYAIAGIGLLLLWDGFDAKDRSVWRIAGGFAPSIGVLAFFLGVVPIAIYVLTYIPFFQLGNGVGDFLDLQKRMFEYHSQLTATHPFGSPWYGWPFGYRAVFLYLAGEGSARSEIWSIPNLVVSWGGLVAMAGVFVRMRRTRQAALGVILLGAAVQYVPWMAVTRVTFMYHYLPVVPWLAIALGCFLARQRKVAIVAVSASAVAVFAFLYPILVGWEMPVGYLDLVRELFPWVI